MWRVTLCLLMYSNSAIFYNMKNQAPPEMTFTFLITSSRGKGYLGMCKETGIIRGGSTPREVETKLLGATTAIVDTVIKHNEYLPSLSSGLPLKYKFIFYLSLLKIVARQAGSFMYFTRDASTLVPSRG